MTAPHVVASVKHANLAHLAAVRVTGTLTADATVLPTTGTPPGALLALEFEPDRGLPYIAWLALGTEHTARTQAEGLLPYLRRGALISVAGSALELRTDHGRACLRVVDAAALVIPHDPIQPTEAFDHAH